MRTNLVTDFLSPSRITDEIECFLKTGNFEPVAGETVCINTTLIDSVGWIETDHLSCPFDAYFPIPISEQLSSDFGLQATSSAYNYCKKKLQSLISEFRLKKTRISLHFHEEEVFELCLGDPNMKNQFHVVHCSNLEDDFGLENLILAASNCLMEDYPEAMLLRDLELAQTF